MLLLAWPPLSGVCLNHEVVMFQPRTVTPLYLGSVINCYVATPLFLTRSALIWLLSDFPLGGVNSPPPPECIKKFSLFTGSLCWSVYYSILTFFVWSLPPILFHNTLEKKTVIPPQILIPPPATSPTISGCLVLNNMYTVSPSIYVVNALYHATSFSTTNVILTHLRVRRHFQGTSDVRIFHLLKGINLFT